MIAYIKRFTDFETVLHSEVTNYELPIEAVAADEKGSVELPMLISPDLVGSWVYLQGRIYLIANIAPQNGRSILTTAMPDEAFGRPIAEGTATQNIGAYILDCLQTNYKNQTDPQYRLSYLEITNADTSAYVPPIVDENGMFVLSDYISAVRAKTKLTYSVDKNKLKIEISKNQPKQHNAVLSKMELKSFTVAKTAIAKVTILGENKTYYLTTSGEASLTVPAERVSGEWVYLKAQKDKTAQETAQAAFDGNINSYKVEFYSKKLYGLHDKIKMNVDNQLLMGDVTFVGRAMKDNRYLVKLGSLPTTAAEKMRAVKVGGGVESVVDLTQPQTLTNEQKTTARTNIDAAKTPIDFIVEQGTSGTWTYRKWNSGIAECWGQFAHTITGWQAWGSAYEGTPGKQFFFPGIFVSTPTWDARMISGSYSVISLAGYGTTTAAQTAILYPIRPNAGGTPIDYVYGIKAIGRWK